MSALATADARTEFAGSTMQGGADAAGPRQKKKAMPLQDMLRKGLLQDGEVLRYRVRLHEAVCNSVTACAVGWKRAYS